MNREDLQRLLMHQEAVRMVRADPSLEARALEILGRWDTVASTRQAGSARRIAALVAIVFVLPAPGQATATQCWRSSATSRCDGW